jgi:hypothetical protein
MRVGEPSGTGGIDGSGAERHPSDLFRSQRRLSRNGRCHDLAAAEKATAKHARDTRGSLRYMGPWERTEQHDARFIRTHTWREGRHLEFYGNGRSIRFKKWLISSRTLTILVSASRTLLVPSRSMKGKFCQAMRAVQRTHREFPISYSLSRLSSEKPRLSKILRKCRSASI